MKGWTPTKVSLFNVTTKYTRAYICTAMGSAYCRSSNPLLITQTCISTCFELLGKPKLLQCTVSILACTIHPVMSFVVVLGIYGDLITIIALQVGITRSPSQVR